MKMRCYFFEHYQGLVINVPKKLYSSEKLAERLVILAPMDLQSKKSFARKYGYSQRQIKRLIKKKRNVIQLPLRVLQKNTTKGSEMSLKKSQDKVS